MAQQIAASEYLARESLEGLTGAQLAIIVEAALDQERFFYRPQCKARALLDTDLRKRLGEIEPPSSSEILDIDEILHKPLHDPMRIGTAAE